MSKAILHLDLHPIATRGADITRALTELMTEAESKRVKSAEVITGKGSGQLMIRVKKFLQDPAIKHRYKRIEIDDKNHGRLYIHFR